MSRRTILTAVLIATLVNIAPFLLFDIGGDSAFHMVLIECFAGQFWQGDLYPRWCMEANARLGGPLMLFYFPLPYYIASLLYPLQALGLPPYYLLVAAMALATFVSGLTCYLWLKDIVTPGRALLASLLFLFMPYRMEAMLFRAAYAEIWALSLLPLLFKYVRRLSQGEQALLPLAITFALLFLTHLPALVVALIASGLYVLLTARERAQAAMKYALSLLWSAAMAAFYLLPLIYYKQFMLPASEIGEQPWANSYLSMANVTEHGQGRIVVVIGLMLLALTILSLYLLRKRNRVDNIFVQREIAAWPILSAVALFLLFPISAPIYALLEPLKQIVFPWRMQSVLAFALTFLLAVRMQWFVSEKQFKTWKADFSMLMALLVLLSYFVVGAAGEDFLENSAKVVATRHATQPEYRTRWTDESRFNSTYIWNRHLAREAIPQFDMLSGNANVTVKQWRWSGIVLHVVSDSQLDLRLDHLYFTPLWSAHNEKGEAVNLRPEPVSGQIVFELPPGEHTITFSYSTGWVGILSYLISFIAAALWYASYRRKPVSFCHPERA